MKRSSEIIMFLFPNGIAGRWWAKDEEEFELSAKRYFAKITRT